MSDLLSLGGKKWTLQNAEGEAGDVAAILRLRRSLHDASATDDWSDPSVFPDAAKAAQRVQDAIDRGETVGIFGDYDCDGVTSSAQLVRFFRRRGIEPVLRLPHRVTDGYGLKPQHIDEFRTAGVRLLITADTGISAGEAVAKARDADIDVIILDHHHVSAVPDAYAILHPALSPHFPDPHPSAAGVVFLFLHALEGEIWPDRETDLALAMFGTVADLVPLRGINRRLVQEGLRALHDLPDGPVRHLVESVGRGQPLTSVDVAFRIAPRINAAGRMADPLLALHALLDGGEPLKELERLNTERQQETLRATEHALELLTKDGRYDAAFLAVADVSYQPGIIGLIAGKLTERFGRPSMAVSINGSECTASLRSPDCYNITAGLARTGHLLTSFGGHSQAAGATFPLDRYMDICDALEKDITANVASDLLIPKLTIDAELAERDLTLRTVSMLKDLEPYGQGNPEPTFLLRNMRLGNVRCVGNEGQHLQATVGASKLIGFGKGEWHAHALQPLDLVCRLGLDHWNGVTRVQLHLVDMRIAETADRLVKM
ncbi:MAG TPA: DHH family phosphoesterase [Candidatus Peribacteraceae bacterium]|nr:DHH family phosphoesterase [Candidatus Peribacteraceae bacterium]